MSTWVPTEFIEAAARSGHPERAAGPLRRLQEISSAAGTDWALGVEARSRALLSEADVAESLYREAIARLSRTRVRPALARAHLLYGEWLRREGRRVDAREQLRIAHSMYAEIGMNGFAERARRERMATGETVRKRSPETRDSLTAAGGADRKARRRGLHELRDRRTAFHQPAHGRVAPAQGVHEARDQFAQRAPRGNARPATRGAGDGHARRNGAGRLASEQPGHAHQRCRSDHISSSTPLAETTTPIETGRCTGRGYAPPMPTHPCLHAAGTGRLAACTSRCTTRSAARLG